MIWNIIPNEIEYSGSLDDFIYKIRQWKPNTCSCRLCKNFSSNTGFVELFYDHFFKNTKYGLVSV